MSGIKSIWGEPDRKYFWEASLTGDLVCGHCQRIRPPHPKAGILSCSSCSKKVELTEEIIDLAKFREKAIFPNGIPTERDQKFKGDNPYVS